MADQKGEIQAQVEAELAGTPYEPSSLRHLSGGITNFIYHATLASHLPDGATEVVLKHGEPYVAQLRDFALTMSRCHLEEECLRYLSQLPQLTSPSFAVSTPKLYYFNRKTSTQVQEYLRDAVSLKDYALKHYAAPTPEALKPQCLQLGRCLGEWLRSFHEWGQQPERQGFRDIVSKDKDMQSLKHMINYKTLVQRVDQQPEILGVARDVFQQVCDQAAAELEDQDKLEVIHGDFWTGNVLIPDVSFAEGHHQTPVKVVDWEMAQLGRRPLDLGQMLAELWQLKLYRGADAGEWLMAGFAAGYGPAGAEAAFRAAVHVGVHLVGFGSTTPGWGSAEQAEQVLRVGRDVVLAAWRRDRAWFQGNALGCLFGE